MKKLPTHELCSIFPKMDGQEFEDLKDDIQKNGLRELIVTYEGKILDGQNRYEACLAAKVAPLFVDFDGDDPVAFVISKNLNRRHLEKGQRSMIAARLATNKHGGPRQGRNSSPVPTQEEAAKIAGVSEDSVKSASKIAKTSEELADMVRDGDVSLNAGAVTAGLPPKKRNAAIGKGPDAVKEAARKEQERERKKRKAESEAVNVDKRNLDEIKKRIGVPPKARNQMHDKILRQRAAELNSVADAFPPERLHLPISCRDEFIDQLLKWELELAKSYDGYAYSFPNPKMVIQKIIKELQT